MRKVAHVNFCALVCVMVAGCGTVSTKLVPRHPDAKFLVPCETGAIPPAKPTGNEADKGWIDATRLLLECKAKHDALADFDKAGPK